MARRGRSRRRSGGGFGSLTRGSGMLGGTLKSVAAGWGAASALELAGIGGIVPAVISGWAVGGGIPGAAGGAAKVYLKGVQLGSGAVSIGGVTVG